MHFFIVTCSKSKNDFLKTGESEYFKRINQQGSIQLIEIAVPDNVAKLPVDQRIEREGNLLLARTKPDSLIIALDENGKNLKSSDLAELISREFNTGCKSISFIIGGPFGLSQTVLKAARYKIALSQFTFTAQLARLILAEQIYRSISIIRGLPYHKD